MEKRDLVGFYKDKNILITGGTGFLGILFSFWV